MPKKPRVEERKHWMLSDEMRTWFVENGWDTEDQFMVDKAMMCDEALKDHPIPDWILYPEKRTQETSRINSNETP